MSPSRTRSRHVVESPGDVEDIVCLGWGSLIWRLDGLPVNGWKPDGPCVRVEFVRQSRDGRLTLVLHDIADPVPSLWAQMKVDTLDEAVKALAKREGGPGKPLSNPETDIGRWPDQRKGDPEYDPANIVNLRRWAAQRHVDYVIWTALGRGSTVLKDSTRRPWRTRLLTSVTCLKTSVPRPGSTCNTRPNRSERPTGHT